MSARARSLAYLLTAGRTGAFKCFRLCLKDSILPPSRRSHYAPSSWPARGSYKTPIRKPSLKGLTTLCPSFLFLFPLFPLSFSFSFFSRGLQQPRNSRSPFLAVELGAVRLFPAAVIRAQPGFEAREEYREKRRYTTSDGELVLRTDWKVNFHREVLSVCFDEKKREREREREEDERRRLCRRTLWRVYSNGMLF